MNKFKSVILAAMLAFSVSAVYAGNDKNECGNSGNNCNTTSPVVGGNSSATGGDALAIAGASSVAEAKANAAAIAAQQQGQAQGQQQGQVATGGDANVKGSGNSANNNKSQASGNSTAVTVGGTTVERSAPAVFAGNIPSVPTSCRLYMFGGGTNVNGAVSGSVPLGNDQTCLSIAKINLMERVGGFSDAEKQGVICKIEGMEELATCKKLK
jgi:hypothetical protein